MIRIWTPKGMQVAHQVVKFSGGEVQVRIEPTDARWYTIEAQVTSSDVLMEVFLVTDAIRRMTEYRSTIHLLMPYLPYARQDRVCAPGEALSLKVVCDLINAQSYESVTIWDAHSDVATACLNRCHNIHCSTFVKRVVDSNPNVILVAPDAGALKKVSDCAKQAHVKMVRADKTRDLRTGDITGTVVYTDHVGAKDFMIVDDICDGGRTFIELAKVLRSLTDGRIGLYVTHGIFSRGLSVFENIIDDLYVANPFPEVIAEPKPASATYVHVDVVTKQETWVI